MRSSGVTTSPLAGDSAFYDSLLHRPVRSPTAAIRPSASIIPWRISAEAGGIEVWWLRRAPTMRFLAGFWAFPGGGVSRRDAEIRIAGNPQGTSEDTFTRAAPELDRESMGSLGPDLAPGVLGGALRELFEETGLLLTERPAPASESREARVHLLRKELSFAELTRRHGRAVASRLVFAGRWLTPPFAPMRFDNRFFLLEWPRDAPDPEPVDDSVEGLRSEHDLSEWVRPEDALRRWQQTGLLAAPPILHVMRVLADEGSPTEQALRRLRDTEEADLGPMRRIEFRPGVVLLPLRTPTLPPATHTNAFLLGNPPGAAVLIDPSTPWPDEQAKLLSMLDAAREQGYRIRSIWLSHHHPDHVGAVEAVWKHLDEPLICAHGADCAALERRGILVDEELVDGQVVRFEGQPDLEVEVLHTPGHTRGHLSFHIPAADTLLACDLTSTLSTIVIDPPDGDMDHYISSLGRLAAREAAILFPSHGPGHPNPRQHLEELIEHRLQREEKIWKAYRDGLSSPSALVGRVYDDVPVTLHPVAERQIAAHLIRLRRLGRIPRY
ncbi:MAG: MBL fold metallo-hydrolase [Thermoanaerobaculia bacterium]|nr:MBL fold metallo-hydrolase [Thermoanaerobaculia bacterium]